VSERERERERQTEREGEREGERERVREIMRSHLYVGAHIHMIGSVHTNTGL